MLDQQTQKYVDYKWPWFIKLYRYLQCKFGIHMMDESEWNKHGRSWCLHCKQWIIRD